MPCCGASNEYPQHVFVESVERYEKYQYFWIEKSILSRAMLNSMLNHLSSNISKHTFWHMHPAKFQITQQKSWPRWLSWMPVQLETRFNSCPGRQHSFVEIDHEIFSTVLPAEVGNILSWRLIMKYFLLSFSPFRWFKKGSCQFLAKECAQYWLILDDCQ